MKVCKVFILIFSLLLLEGCGKVKSHFVGEWVNAKAKVPWICVEEDGEYYKVKSDITGPVRAILKDGVLYISDCEFRQPLTIDKMTGELIYADVRYQRK